MVSSASKKGKEERDGKRGEEEKRRKKKKKEEKRREEKSKNRSVRNLCGVVTLPNKSERVKFLLLVRSSFDFNAIGVENIDFFGKSCMFWEKG